MALSKASPVVLAHRGFSAEAPENTMAAFRRARDAGAEGIEIDVHMCRDGELVVIHDERLDRTTDGRGLVAEHTWDELQRLDAGAWFGQQFAGERLPGFRQVCEFCASWGGLLNVELKNSYIEYEGLEAAVLKLVQEYGLARQVLVSSFNHYSLKRCSGLMPELPTALLYSARLYEPWTYARSIGAAALHPMYRTVDEALVLGAHAAGVAVRPWTVDDDGTLSRMTNLGVDAIITNRPDRALVARASSSRS